MKMNDSASIFLGTLQLAHTHFSAVAGTPEVENLIRTWRCRFLTGRMAYVMTRLATMEKDGKPLYKVPSITGV